MWGICGCYFVPHGSASLGQQLRRSTSRWAPSTQALAGDSAWLHRQCVISTTKLFADVLVVRNQWLSPWSAPVSSGSVPGAGHTGCGEVRMWWKGCGEGSHACKNKSYEFSVCKHCKRLPLHDFSDCKHCKSFWYASTALQETVVLQECVLSVFKHFHVQEVRRRCCCHVST